MRRKKMEKPGVLFLFQVDHLSGEEVGYLMKELYGWGAENVNVLSTLTKKNRPGYVILVDPGGMDIEGLVEKMARSFGISGCHRMETKHFYLRTECHSVPLTVCFGERCLDEEVEVKVIGAHQKPLFRRLEYDSLMTLCPRLEKALGISLSLLRIKRSLEARLKKEDSLELHFSARERSDGL